MFSVEELIETLRERRLGTIFVVKMIPESLWDWKPTSDMRPISDLANHLVNGPTILLELIQGNIPNPESYNAFIEKIRKKNAQELTELFEKGLNNLITYLEEHKEAANQEIKLFPEKVFRTSTVGAEVFFEIQHQWLHLGQLVTYLRQNDIPVGEGAYSGFEDPDPSIPPNS